MPLLESLSRLLHRPDPTQWKSRAASRRDALTARLGWRRTPIYSGPDPQSASARLASQETNEELLRILQSEAQVPVPTAGFPTPTRIQKVSTTPQPVDPDSQ